MSLFITSQINKPVKVNSNIEMESTGVPTISGIKALCTNMVINFWVNQL